MGHGKVYDMVVIGGGPGGLTAALYAARAGLDTLVLEKAAAGGQMLLTDRIDNYPGAPDGIDGFTLAERMKQGAERFGAVLQTAEALRADLSADPKAIETTAGTVYGKTVVYAAGAIPRTLGLPGEAGLTGRGVAYCAVCDGRFYQGKTAAVVGGGNSAAADALYLSRIAKRVYLIHRRNELRAERAYRQQLEQAGNVTFCWDSVVTGLLAGDRLTGVQLENVKTGETDALACDGVFISVGREPATGLAAQLALAPDGAIDADGSTRTSIPGVFAVGDVRAKAVRQIVTALADGAAAAHFAGEYLLDAR